MIWSSVSLSDLASLMASSQAETISSGEKNEFCSMFSQVRMCVSGVRVSKVLDPSV